MRYCLIILGIFLLPACVNQNYKNKQNYEVAKGLSRQLVNVMQNHEKGLTSDSTFKHKADSLTVLIDSVKNILDPLSLKALDTYNAELLDKWIRDKMKEEDGSGG